MFIASYNKDDKPGTWHRVKAPAASRVGFVCLNGHIGVLDHEVAEDGTVTPSVECPRVGCDFHDHIKLEGWKP